MKKNLFVALLALTCSFTACAKDQVITYDQVPEPAKAIVAAHFDATQVAYVLLDKGLFDDEYEVRFNDGRTIEFNKAGELLKVDCKLMEVPSALIPEPVQAYVKASFPNAFITEWGKDDRGRPEVQPPIRVHPNRRLKDEYPICHNRRSNALGRHRSFSDCLHDDEQ